MIIDDIKNIIDENWESRGYTKKSTDVFLGALQRALMDKGIYIVYNVHNDTNNYKDKNDRPTGSRPLD